MVCVPSQSKVSDGDNKGNTPLHLLHLFNSKVIVDGCRQVDTFYSST